jgi:hypothetical protein
MILRSFLTPVKILIWLLIAVILPGQSIHGQSNPQNRVLVLTDIEADPDDTQSLIRLLLYTNEIDIKGIIATTSCWQQSRIAPESIEKLFGPMVGYNQTCLNILKGIREWKNFWN